MGIESDPHQIRTTYKSVTFGRQISLPPFFCIAVGPKAQKNAILTKHYSTSLNGRDVTKDPTCERLIQVGSSVASSKHNQAPITKDEF